MNENNITFKDLILKYLIEEIEKKNNALYFFNNAVLLNCLNTQSSKKIGGLNV